MQSVRKNCLSDHSDFLEYAWRAVKEALLDVRVFEIMLSSFAIMFVRCREIFIYDMLEFFAERENVSVRARTYSATLETI